MSLYRVTITGADDGVDPQALVDLSERFPFVEWGILFSRKRLGEPRYPSLSWRVRLERAMKPWVRLSAHLCGALARGVIAGDGELVGSFRDHYYTRLQVNGWVPSSAMHPIVWNYPGEVILQAGSVEVLRAAAAEAREIHEEAPSGWYGDVSCLWDCSGGSGTSRSEWPRPPFGLRLGYAGGIGPDNVLDVLRKVSHPRHRFWIDMESGVRTDNRFDLEKVRAVLEAAAPWVQTSVEPSLAARLLEAAQEPVEVLRARLEGLQREKREGGA